MVIEDDYNRALEYIKKHNHINTFRLARELRIDRHKLLNVIKELQEKQAIELKYGNVRFLKFPSKEKKAKIEVKKALSAPKIRAKSNELSAQKARLHEKTKLLGSLQYENKGLKEKLSELEGSIKRQHYAKSRKFREQDELIEKLENRIEALQEKAKSKPKIVIRKVKVPPEIITKTIVKRIIKKVPVEVIKKVHVRVKEREAKPKFKLPKINFPDIKNIQQLERPDFLEQKIRVGKFNFSGLNKNIQQLHVPGMLRNN